MGQPKVKKPKSEDELTDEERFDLIVKKAAKMTDDHNKKYGTNWVVGRDGGKAIDRKTGKSMNKSKYSPNLVIKKSPAPKGKK